MAAFGFDFGTTNSLISFIAGDRAINILDDGYPFPSVVCYLGDKKIVGVVWATPAAMAALGAT